MPNLSVATPAGGRRCRSCNGGSKNHGRSDRDRPRLPKRLRQRGDRGPCPPRVGGGGLARRRPAAVHERGQTRRGEFGAGGRNAWAGVELSRPRSTSRRGGARRHAFGARRASYRTAWSRGDRRTRRGGARRRADRHADRHRRSDVCDSLCIRGPGMALHFIGAGPGAPDLITLRGRDLIARCPVCLYAGSLVPKALLDHCPPGARIVDTAPLDLDAIIALCVEATARSEDVARLHSGDLSIWSAMGEQLRRLKRAGVAYTVTPGVPAFAAAAAALERELTLPGLAQSLVLTRTSGRASPMPGRETLANFAASGATLAIHLSIHALDDVIAELTPFYGADCPAAVVARASWPDERIVGERLGEK